MPYVKASVRNMLDVTYAPLNEGELNYTLTKICDDYLKRKGVNYPTLNAVVGALECAKQELYRRVAVPYEEIKKEANGDVYSEQVANPVPRP